MKRLNTNDYEKYLKGRVIPAQAGIHLIPSPYPLPAAEATGCENITATHGFSRVEINSQHICYIYQIYIHFYLELQSKILYICIRILMQYNILLFVI